MADSSQEKTEEATPKRLRESRKKGQVAKSKDLNTVVILIIAFVVLIFMKGYIGSYFKGIMVSNFTVAVSPDLNLAQLFVQIKQSAYVFAKLIAPFGLIIVFVAVAIGFFQIGPIFSADPMKPQMKRLNAIDNLKNMFKMTTVVELLKNIAKISVIFLLAYLVVKGSLRDVVSTVLATPDQSLQLAARLITEFLSKVFVVFIFIALIDLAVQRWNYKKNMRMSKDEVKREYKQDEGDPQIKGQRKQLHRELAMGDTQGAVKSADAVITNPTEVAVVIKYNDADMAAPEIIAKGQRLYAQTIREMAQEFNVPIIENVPLAWALMELDIGDEVPEELYATVAEILMYVYRLRESNELRNS